MAINHDGATEVANRYWRINDKINQLAQELRPTGNGSFDAEQFLHLIEDIPGYAEYFQQSLKFRNWMAEQRDAIPARKPNADLRFASDSCESVSGVRQAPCLDSQKVATFFRANPLMFLVIIA